MASQPKCDDRHSRLKDTIVKFDRGVSHSQAASQVRLYLSNDTSSRAAGTADLAELWAQRPDVQVIRTSSRGAFFLEPMVERDTPDGRIGWFDVTPDDLSRIRAGVGGTSIEHIPFLAPQTRFTFSNFGILLRTMYCRTRSPYVRRTPPVIWSSRQRFRRYQTPDFSRRSGAIRRACSMMKSFVSRLLV